MKITEKLGLKKPEPSDTFDIQDFNDNADILDRLWEIVYPVGAIYMSANAVSPQDLFGGTWVQIENRFLLSAGSSYTAGATGGEAAHKLVANEIPKMSGTIRVYNDYNLNNTSATGVINGVFSYDEAESYGTSSNLAAGSSDACRNVKFNFGGDAAHNNMPPYLVVYMWERTA